MLTSRAWPYTSAHFNMSRHLNSICRAVSLTMANIYVNPSRHKHCLAVRSWEDRWTTTVTLRMRPKVTIVTLCFNFVPHCVVAFIMAYRQAFANYLQSVGFPVELRLALFGQGVDNITSFLGMSDEDIEDLCANMRKPGGLIPNPGHADDPDLPEYIADPGVAVGRIYQERRKQIAYYYSYLVIVGRNFVANQATIEELVRLWKYKKNLQSIMKNKKDDDDGYPEKFTNAKSPREFIESMEN